MKKLSEKILFEGEWLSLVQKVYRNKDGEMVSWESVVRKNEVKAMVVIAQLMPSKRIVLIKQFRPAIEGYILGLPAGLYADDTAHALTELKEETGYTGEIIDVSPTLKSGSGIVNDSGQIVYAHIDERLPANQNPQQQLEPTEDIEVILIKKEEARAFIEKEWNKGTYIGANLWHLFVISAWLQ